MNNHKAKFVSPIIYNELCTLEVKKNGRIEHASNAHDDQIFSMLLALYVWYEGKDLMEHFGLDKGTITTDDDETIEEGLNEEYTDITRDIDIVDDPELKESLEFLKEGSKSVSYNDFIRKQFEDEQKLLNRMIHTDPIAKKAYCEKNHLDPNEIGGDHMIVDLPQSVFMGTFNSDFDRIDTRSELQKQFDNITNLR